MPWRSKTAHQGSQNIWKTYHLSPNVLLQKSKISLENERVVASFDQQYLIIAYEYLNFLMPKINAMLIEKLTDMWKNLDLYIDAFMENDR